MGKKLVVVICCVKTAAVVGGSGGHFATERIMVREVASFLRQQFSRGNNCLAVMEEPADTLSSLKIGDHVL